MPDLKEFTSSHAPALILLEKLGYEYITPVDALVKRGGRKSIPILLDVLEGQIRKMNYVSFHDERHEFSNANIQRAIREISSVPFDSLIHTSEHIYDLLTLGISLEQTISGNVKSHSLHYIDWDHPENNVFHVVDEFEFERRNRKQVYHLSVLESFLKQAGVEFSRDFDLNPRSIKQAMFSQVKLALYGGKLQLELDNVRKYLKYVPMNKELADEFKTSKPLLTMVGAPNGYKVYYGNRNLTNLSPQFFEFDDSLSSLELTVDGRRKVVDMGTIIDVSSGFSVKAVDGYRFNIIGFVAPNKGVETNVLVRKKDLVKRFSLDKGGRVYRVEAYRGEKFSGMVLVRFVRNKSVAVK